MDPRVYQRSDEVLDKYGYKDIKDVGSGVTVSEAFYFTIFPFVHRSISVRSLFFTIRSA
jgi:hypothetical protein